MNKNLNSNILITSGGYVGTFLKIFLKIKGYKNITVLKKNDFNNIKILKKKLIKANVIFHTAAVVNKFKDNFSENVIIANKLINSINNITASKIINFSSIHQKKNNEYGISKKISANLIKDYCLKEQIHFINLIIPNVFGEFYKPNHNSFVSTICYNMINDLNIDIKDLNNNNKNIELIYISDLINKILICTFSNKSFKGEYRIRGNTTNLLSIYKIIYKINISIKENKDPRLNIFNKKIYNVLLSYIYQSKKNIYQPFNHLDNRGSLWEIFKSQDTSHIFASTIMANKIRGGHFHTFKYEKFCVIQGEAQLICKNIYTNQSIKYTLNALNLNVITIPPYVHHKLISLKKDTIGLFMSSHYFDIKDHDTYEY